MRLRQRDLKTVYVRPWGKVKDNEGAVTNGYGDPFEAKATIQPLGGQIAAAEYGETLKYMLSMKVNDSRVITFNDKAYVQVKNGVITEKDGVCVYVASTEKPDYEVISIKPWDIPVLELKKRGV